MSKSTYYQRFKTEEQRFWEKVDKSGDCWEWTGNIAKNGYGPFGYQAKMQYAHRVAWQLTNGSIPKGDHHGTICVLHHCDNPGCVNPDHLFLGSHQDNMDDMINKGRQVTVCGEDHGCANMTEENVLSIRSMDGLFTRKEIGIMFSISAQNASDIMTGKLWRHIL